MRRIFLFGWILALSACLSIGLSISQAAERVQIVSTQLEQAPDGYKLSAVYQFDLNDELRDAVDRGIPLFFTTAVELVQPRWYWFDKVVSSKSRTKRIAYNVLTRQYRVTTSSGQNYYFESLEDALYAIQQPSSWIIAEKGALKPGVMYQLSLRMYLDLEHLPKPFQVNAFNNQDWRLSSERKILAFKAESK
jgi:hypothetical protein